MIKKSNDKNSELLGYCEIYLTLISSVNEAVTTINIPTHNSQQQF